MKGGQPFLLALICLLGQCKGDLCRQLKFKGECLLDEKCYCICFDISAEGTYVDAAYFGELGYELMLFTPMAHYYHTEGVLRRTAGTIGSQPFYVWSPNHTEIDRARNGDCQGFYSHPVLHLMPGEQWNFELWRPPAYQQFYRNNLLGSDKPIVVIHNKHNMEWGKAPANFIDIPTLLQLFSMLTQRYKIVYIRPDPGHYNLPGFSRDRSDIYDWNDFDEIRKWHPEVMLFQDLLQQQRANGGPGQTFNELQMLIHAECNQLISVQGGSSILASYFAGLNIIYARAGREVENPEKEYFHTYPRLGINGNGTIVHVTTYRHLLHAAAEHLLDGPVTVH